MSRIVVSLEQDQKKPGSSKTGGFCGLKDAFLCHVTLCQPDASPGLVAGGWSRAGAAEAASGGYVNARDSVTFDRQPSRRVYTTVTTGVWSNALEAETTLLATLSPASLIIPRACNSDCQYSTILVNLSMRTLQYIYQRSTYQQSMF